MKKTVFSLAVLMWLIVFTWCGKTTTTPEVEEDTPVVAEEMTQEKFESTMDDLYKKGGKMTCTMTTLQDGVQMNGILYIDGKKMRSDVKWTVEGMNIEMSTIIKDGLSYTRSSMSKEWWKMVYDEEETEEGLNDASTDTDTDTPMSFSCKKGVQGADFELPADIQFKELQG